MQYGILIIGRETEPAMNIVKLNTRNQISIPKEVIEKVTLGEERVFKVVANDQNQIIVTPISTEPILPQAAIDAMVAETIQTTKKAKSYRSLDTMFHDLDKSKEKK